MVLIEGGVLREYHTRSGFDRGGGGGGGCRGSTVPGVVLIEGGGGGGCRGSTVPGVVLIEGGVLREYHTRSGFDRGGGGGGGGCRGSTVPGVVLIEGGEGGDAEGAPYQELVLCRLLWICRHACVITNLPLWLKF